jgi:hypothetical protein
VIDLNALGSFLSGAGAVLSAVWVVRRVRKADAEECERRFAAFREGLKLGKEGE